MMKAGQEIKNIIFDLGGVILNIDYHLTMDAFRKLGMEEFFSQQQQTEMVDLYEKGFISSDEFRNQIKSHLPADTKTDQIDRAWNIMLLDLPIERIELLTQLKKKYRLFLLSNTNEIHIRAFSNYLWQTFGFDNLSHLFEKEYLSYQLGMRKPDKEIFEFVLDENGLKAEQTIFIDDSPQHIEGAKQTGIHTIWLEKGKTILDLWNKEALI